MWSVTPSGDVRGRVLQKRATLGTREVKSIYSGPCVREWGLSWDLAVGRDSETRRQKIPHSRLCSVHEWLLYCREAGAFEVASLFLDPFSGWWRPDGLQGKAWFSEDLVRVAHRNVLKEQKLRLRCCLEFCGQRGKYRLKILAGLSQPSSDSDETRWFIAAAARMSLCLALQVPGRTRDHAGGHLASWHLKNLLLGL